MLKIDPATPKQCYAIKCMSNQDVREWGLSKQEASEMIRELKKGTPDYLARWQLPKALKDYMLERVDSLALAMKNAFLVDFKVSDISETNLQKIGVLYSQSSHKAPIIEDAAKKIRTEVKIAAIAKISRDDQVAIGNLGYDLSARSFWHKRVCRAYWQMVVNFMKTVNVYNPEVVEKL